MVNILIADDELFECRVLAKMVSENITGVHVLPFAANGMELIDNIKEYHPDITITDINMPEADGLTAVEKIREQFPKMKLIIVTAYGEFEYAKHALQLGSLDYILKPVQPELLIRSVKKAVEAVQEEQKEHISEKEKNWIKEDYHTLMVEGFMTNLLLGDLRQDHITRLLGLLKHPYYGGVSLSFRLIGQDGNYNSIQGNLTKLFDKINHLQECTCIAGSVNKEHICCLFPRHPVLNQEVWIQKQIGELGDVVSEASLLVAIGVGGFKKSIRELPESYRESFQILRNQKHYGIYKFEKDDSDPLRNVFDRCVYLLHDRFLEAAELIIGTLKNYPKSITSRQLTVQFGYFLIHLERTVNKKAPRTGFWASELFFGETDIELYMKKTSGLLQKLLENIVSGSERKLTSNPIVSQSIEYTRLHFAEDISLSDAAGYCNLNPSYFSRLFTKEMGKGYWDFVTEIRIERALELLADQERSIQNIGETIGYPNANYFYKIFKKKVGVSISEMRQYIRLY